MKVETIYFIMMILIFAHLKKIFHAMKDAVAIAKRTPRDATRVDPLLLLSLYDVTLHV